jgi:hypothetical protein
MEEKKSNCIGYAYHELGITSTEEPKYLPDLNDVLSSFDRVETINEADVMAVGFLSSIGNDLIVIHMALWEMINKVLTIGNGKASLLLVME